MHVLICPLHNVLRCYSYRVVFQSYKVWVLPASFFCHVACPFLFISVSSNMRLKCTYSLTFRICDLWNVVLTINLSLIVLLSKIFYIFSTRAQLAGGGSVGGRRFTWVFLQTEAKCPGLRDKSPDCVIYGLNFSFKMLFLRLPRRKKAELFFLSCAAVEIFIEMPLF